MRNKRKGILMASAILGSAAIVSTGFAAWVISTPTEANVGGNIQVDTVTDNRVTMTAKWADNEEWNVSFGAPQNATSGWLTNTGDDIEPESLTNTLKIELGWANSARQDALNGTITVDFKVGSQNASEFTSDYIVVPQLRSSINVVDGQVDDLEVNFAFGKVFADKGATQGTNPYTYFNSKTANAKPSIDEHMLADGTKTWADIAYTALKGLSDCEVLTYSITLTFTLTESKSE